MSDYDTETLQQAIKMVDDAADDISRKLDDMLNGDGIAIVPVADVAKLFFALKMKHEELDTARKRISKTLDYLDKHVIPSSLEHEGTDMIRVPEIKRSFGIRNMTTASMIDREAAFKWLRENGHGDMVQETVNAGTLASFARNLMLEEGIDLPNDIFKVNSYRKTGVTQYKPRD